VFGLNTGFLLSGIAGQSFADQARQNSVHMPKLHFIAMNRAKVTGVLRDQAGKLHLVGHRMINFCSRLLFDAWQSNPELFSSAVQFADQAEFNDGFMQPIPDLYGAGIAATHYGAPLSMVHNADPDLKKLIGDEFGHAVVRNCERGFIESIKSLIRRMENDTHRVLVTERALARKKGRPSSSHFCVTCKPRDVGDSYVMLHVARQRKVVRPRAGPARGGGGDGDDEKPMDAGGQFLETLDEFKHSEDDGDENGREEKPYEPDGRDENGGAGGGDDDEGDEGQTGPAKKKAKAPRSEDDASEGEGKRGGGPSKPKKLKKAH
jgi:hypothetical protein